MGRCGAPPGTPSRRTSTRSTVSTTRERRPRTKKTLGPRATTSRMTTWAENIKAHVVILPHYFGQSFVVKPPFKAIFRNFTKLVFNFYFCHYSSSSENRLPLH